MSDLSAYLDFKISLDFKQGKIVISDTSAYPAGVSSAIKGIISVQQPDRIWVNGDWNSPSIVFQGSVLSSGLVELRSQANGKPQQGVYTITYTVDHPDYTPTTSTKTFILSYAPVEPVIRPSFDVFTPSIKASDSTVYDVSGFNTPSLSKQWHAQVGTIGSVSGSSDILDLVINSGYYDAVYDITLTVQATYQHTVYSFLTVIDELTATYRTTADTPPSFPAMEGYLKEIKSKYDNLSPVQRTVSNRQDYEYAAGLLGQIKSRICKGDTVNLYPQIQDFINVYNQYSSSLYQNTNTTIPTYDYSSVIAEQAEPLLT
jgi:hypothetical protein